MASVQNPDMFDEYPQITEEWFLLFIIDLRQVKVIRDLSRNKT